MEDRIWTKMQVMIHSFILRYLFMQYETRKSMAVIAMAMGRSCIIRRSCFQIT